MGALDASAGSVPIWGGPIYPASTDVSPSSGIFATYGKTVNDDGTAIAFIRRYDRAMKHDMGFGGLRWNGLGMTADLLGALGADAHGYADSVPRAINNEGVVVGSSHKYEKGHDRGVHATRWGSEGTAATDLGDLGEDSNGIAHAIACDINDAGVIIGSARKFSRGRDEGMRAVRWTPEGTQATELGALGASPEGYAFCQAYSLNNAGVAIGSARLYENGRDKGMRAVRWNPGEQRAIVLDSLGVDANGSTYSEAFAINDAGMAVGYAIKFAHGVFQGYRAVRWMPKGTQATELDVPARDGGTCADARACAINSAGMAVGYVQMCVNGRNEHYRAVRWESGGPAVTELGSLASDAQGQGGGEACAINNAGVTVGFVNRYDTAHKFLGRRAVYWGRDGKAVDLNDLIDPNSGWVVLQAAKGISNTGWITGIGLYDPDRAGGQKAYRRPFLVEIPEASSPADPGPHPMAVSKADRKG
jgi:uncharacterized membrane protein